jgi:hypothetical protein
VLARRSTPPHARAVGRDFPQEPVALDEHLSGPDAKQLTYRDAVLYLGPPSAMTFSRLPASLCSDARYVEMRLERVRLTGIVDEESRMREELKGECAAHPPK